MMYQDAVNKNVVNAVSSINKMIANIIERQILVANATGDHKMKLLAQVDLTLCDQLQLLLDKLREKV